VTVIRTPDDDERTIGRPSREWLWLLLPLVMFAVVYGVLRWAWSRPAPTFNSGIGPGVDP
jgi:hypothetical protein